MLVLNILSLVLTVTICNAVRSQSSNPIPLPVQTVKEETSVEGVSIATVSKADESCGVYDRATDGSPKTEPKCPSGYEMGHELFKSLCYQKCKTGYVADVGFKWDCYEKCPQGYKTERSMCSKGTYWFIRKSYHRGENVSQICPEDQDKAGRFCYPKCREGYYMDTKNKYSRCLKRCSDTVEASSNLSSPNEIVKLLSTCLKFDSFKATLTGSVSKINVKYRWRDQGWGNRKGSIRLDAFNTDGGTKIATLKITKGVAPHRWTNVDMDVPTKQLEKLGEGTALKLFYCVGGGGGHKLYVKNFKVEIFYKPKSDASSTSMIGIGIQHVLIGGILIGGVISLFLLRLLKYEKNNTYYERLEDVDHDI